MQAPDWAGANPNVALFQQPCMSRSCYGEGRTRQIATAWVTHTVSSKDRLVLFRWINPNSCLGVKPESNARMGDSTMTLTISIAVGIDVCKPFLDVYHSHTRARARFDNDPEGIASLLDWLVVQGSTDVIALEATGGYEALCWQTLEAYGLAVTRLNPKRVRDYAKAAGILSPDRPARRRGVGALCLGRAGTDHHPEGRAPA
jgi:hypothetical protein